MWSQTQNSDIPRTMTSLFDVIQSQDKKMATYLEEQQLRLLELKKEISISSKKNFTLEREIRNLDQKIALLVKNRISLEEVMASAQTDMSLVNKTIAFKDTHARELYGQFFYLLQSETTPLARLARIVKLSEIDNLLQMVMFTLFGNQYDEHEELLLLSMFQKVLAEEFAHSKGIGSLLRANTALTRMMTTYTRRGPGQQYLKLTLTPVLQQITSHPDLILEVNPLKVYETMINEIESKTGQQVTDLPRKTTPEEAALNPRVQEIIAPRFKKLGELAETFLDAIILSMEQVPYGIRWICKQIKELTKAKFPEVSFEQCCSLIGGFFLLRFVNPAIVTPQAFMLCDSKLSVNTRRNLTLLAKVLQNLANNVQFGGVKEFFMAPLNTVLDKNRARVNTFLDKMTLVDNLEEHLKLDEYLVLGKTDGSIINISLNEIYFTHALFKEHIEEIIPKEDWSKDPIIKILNQLGEAPPQLLRKENANVDLRLDNSASVNKDTQTPEQLFLEAKYLLYTIIKSLTPADKRKDLKSQLEAASMVAVKPSAPQKMRENIIRLKELIAIMAKSGQLREEDGYSTLIKEAIQDVLGASIRVTKTDEDIKRLQAVLQNILEHNKFLQDQFGAYKEYLENVRQSCGTVSVKKTKKTPDALKKEAPKSASQKPHKKITVKMSHGQLEREGVIISSDVPDDRRSGITFVFTNKTRTEFEVEVTYRTRHVASLTLNLDDLQERQHNNELEYETDFLKLNVNLLLFLLSKHFGA
eukprot:TRINITY_DN10846_c0_g1_i1.p1 TRINITY_DN10846_c0_g1~~TRINITY_DN10846_c0_g1_i1.p1  ORF type:complete len:756 (+),score=287.52 TRINITY_DN10846_c0_g1_i1:30-2297(+)